MNRWREKNSHSPNRRNGQRQNGRNGRQNFPRDETFATNAADLAEDFNFEASNQLFDKQQVYGEMNMDRMISSKLRKNILILTRFFSARPPGRQGEVKFRHDENVMDAYNAKYGGTEYESTPGTQSPVTVPQWRCKDNSRDRIAAHGNAHDLRQKIFASLASNGSNGEEKRDFIHTLATTTTSFIVRLVLIRA